MLRESPTKLNSIDRKPLGNVVHELAPRSTDIKICDATSSDRSRVEQFIKEGFARAHGAQVTEFSPDLIYVEDSRIRAALGIRSARRNLFLEQYLDLPIEYYVSSSSIVPRSRIAEIGNLCSSNRRYTISLFIAAAAVLEQRGYTHAVFCATRKVATIIESSGVNLCRIAAASGDRLGDRLTEWGSYYECEPTIVSISLADVASVIAQTQRFFPEVSAEPGFAGPASGLQDAI